MKPIMKIVLLWVAQVAFALTQTFADGIISVSPESATVGTSGLLLTVELDSGAFPPLPPSEVIPSNVRIGTVEGTSISRNGYTVTATFDIAISMAAGEYAVEVEFNPPGVTYDLQNGFEVLAGETGPEVVITNSNVTLAQTVESYSVGGTNGAEVVGTMTWTNQLNGSSGSFAASSSWIFTVSLAEGENHIVVSGSNALGAVGSDDVVYTRLPSAPSKTYTIVDTGQSETYGNTNAIAAPSAGSSFYGQDAQHDGVQPSFINHQDGTITDANTGLMW